MQGIGGVSKVDEFGALAISFHLLTLHEFLKPFCAEGGHSFFATTFGTVSVLSFILERNLRTSINKDTADLKTAHALNEMWTLAAFVSTVVATIFARESRGFCMFAGAIRAFCYMHRFYHETPFLNKISKSGLESTVPGCLKEVSCEKKIICPGRDNELKSMFITLNAQKRNNVALIGPSGAGKTHLFRYLAQRVKDGECPDVFKGYRFFEIDMNGIKADSGWLGTWEGRLQKIFEFARKTQKVVLFLDEGHQAVGAGSTFSTAGTNSVANEMKKFLEEDGEHRVVLATTDVEWRALMADAAFGNRFEQRYLKPFSPEQAKVVLEGSIKEYEKDGWVFPKNFIEKINQLSEGYFQGSMRDHLSIIHRVVSYLDLFVEGKNISEEKLEEALKWWKDDHSSLKEERV